MGVEPSGGGSTPVVIEEEAVDHAHEEEEPVGVCERQVIVMDGHHGVGSSRRSYGRTVHSLHVTKETMTPAVLVGLA